MCRMWKMCAITIEKKVRQMLEVLSHEKSDCDRLRLA